MVIPKLEAPTVGSLDTLLELEVLLGVPLLPLPVPTFATGAAAGGTVWGKAAAPSAAARATALGTTARPGGTL